MFGLWSLHVLYVTFKIKNMGRGKLDSSVFDFGIQGSPSNIFYLKVDILGTRLGNWETGGVFLLLKKSLVVKNLLHVQGHDFQNIGTPLGLLKFRFPLPQQSLTLQKVHCSSAMVYVRENNNTKNANIIYLSFPDLV